MNAAGARERDDQLWQQHFTEKPIGLTALHSSRSGLQYGASPTKRTINSKLMSTTPVSQSQRLRIAIVCLFLFTKHESLMHPFPGTRCSQIQTPRAVHSESVSLWSPSCAAELKRFGPVHSIHPRIEVLLLSLSSYEIDIRRMRRMA